MLHDRPPALLVQHHRDVVIIVTARPQQATCLRARKLSIRPSLSSDWSRRHGQALVLSVLPGMSSTVARRCSRPASSFGYPPCAKPADPRLRLKEGSAIKIRLPRPKQLLAEARLAAAPARVHIRFLPLPVDVPLCLFPCSASTPSTTIRHGWPESCQLRPRWG